MASILAMHPLILFTISVAILSGLFVKTSLADDHYSSVAVMYHHFGDERYPSTNIRLEQFDAHLNFLAENKFNVWPLARIISTLQQNKQLPDKTIAITMDDAYSSIYHEAFPRLKKRGWPFTVFVSTDYIDKSYSNYMSWEQMREMEKSGASYGNHSSSHRHLIRHHEHETKAQWQQRVRDDIQKAQRRLNEELKQVIPFFAYPYGEYNLELADIIASEELIGMGQQSGAIGINSDVRFLPRYPLAEKYGDMEGVASKLMSLAMPIVTSVPLEPFTTEPRPTLKITLDKQQPRLEQLSCYVSGQGRVDVQWQNEYSFSVQAKEDLPPGRSRYNCTAPSSEAGRFYWFSQAWIRPGGIEPEN